MLAGQSEGRQPRGLGWRETVTTLVGILSLLAVAVGLYITNKANRDQQKLAQLSRPRPDSRPDKRDRRRLVRLHRDQI